MFLFYLSNFIIQNCYNCIAWSLCRHNVCHRIDSHILIFAEKIRFNYSFHWTTYRYQLQLLQKFLKQLGHSSGRCINDDIPVRESHLIRAHSHWITERVIGEEDQISLRGWGCADLTWRLTRYSSYPQKDDLITPSLR